MSQFVRKVAPQKPEESRLTSEIIPRYTNFLYNHANMRGQFLCLNSKNGRCSQKMDIKILMSGSAGSKRHFM